MPEQWDKRLAWEMSGKETQARFAQSAASKP